MVRNRTCQMLCAWTAGLLFAASIACSVSGVTIVDHGFATTVPTRDSDTGMVAGFVDLQNDGDSAELVNVSAIFFDEDGCGEDVLAEWPETPVLLNPTDSVRILFRLLHVSEQAVANAHGFPDAGRDISLDLTYRIAVESVAAQSDVLVASTEDFLAALIQYTHATSLVTIRGVGRTPVMDWDGNYSPGSSFACVPTLSGTFTSIIDANPASANLELGLRSNLLVIYQDDVWTLASISSLSKDGWASQVFYFAGYIGAWSLAAMSQFNPSTPASVHADLQLASSIAGMSFHTRFVLEPGSTGFWAQMQGYDVAGRTYEAAFYFNLTDRGMLIQTGCHTVFTSAELTMDGVQVACMPDVVFTPTLTLTAAGFESFVIEFTGLELESLPWVTFVGTLQYALDEKTMEINVLPNFLPWDDCITISLLFGSYSPQTSITDITVEKLFVECTLDTVNFEAVSYFYGTGTRARAKMRYFSSNLTDSYWEWLRFWSTQDDCCGPLEFELAFYFKEGGVRLFDVAAIQALLTLQLAPTFKLGTAMEFDLDAVSDQWVYWDVYFEIDF